MSYPYRCSKCKQRVSLSKHKEAYKRKDPVCKACGGSLTLDKYRRNVEGKKYKCLCDGYPFPHRMGSKMCNENDTPLTEEDYRDFYRRMSYGD